MVDAGDAVLEVVLDDAVELDALSGGDAEGAVGVVIGDGVEA